MHKPSLAHPSLALATILLSAPFPTLAQNSTTATNATEANDNCTTIYNTANATGSTSFTLPIIRSTAQLNWDFTVSSPGHPAPDPGLVDSYEANFWLGTPPDVNLFDGSNGYSGCAILINIPPNTIKRGQTDDGDCSQTLSADCATALQNAAAAKALELTGTLPVKQPISNGPLDFATCEDIAQSLNVDGKWSSVCAPYFVNDDGSVLKTWTAQPITGNSTVPTTCTVHPPSSDPAYNYTALLSGFNTMATGDMETDDAVYDALAQAVHPILTVFFPQANDTRDPGTSITTSEASLKCLRITNYLKRSRVPMPLGPANPVDVPDMDTERGLGKGAIAGIVIGVLLGIALVAGGAWVWIRKKGTLPFSGTTFPWSGRGAAGRGRGYSNLGDPSPYLGAGEAKAVRMGPL